MGSLEIAKGTNRIDHFPATFTMRFKMIMDPKLHFAEMSAGSTDALIGSMQLHMTVCRVTPRSLVRANKGNMSMLLVISSLQGVPVVCFICVKCFN